MEVLRTIITVLFVLVCIVLTVIVLMQEGKNNGLSGAISGSSETYWSKNKGRSMEGKLGNITKILAVVFLILAVVLNMGW